MKNLRTAFASLLLASAAFASADAGLLVHRIGHSLYEYYRVDSTGKEISHASLGQISATATSRAVGNFINSTGSTAFCVAQIDGGVLTVNEYAAAGGPPLRISTIPLTDGMDTVLAFTDLDVGAAGHGTRREILLRDSTTGAMAAWAYNTSKRPLNALKIPIADTGAAIPPTSRFIGAGVIDNTSPSPSLIFEDTTTHVVSFAVMHNFTVRGMATETYDPGSGFNGNFVGAADVDGDGVVDLLNVSAHTQVVNSFWLMNVYAHPLTRKDTAIIRDPSGVKLKEREVLAVGE